MVASIKRFPSRVVWALMLVLSSATIGFAQSGGSGVTLPTPGFAVGDYITAAVTTLGTGIAVAVGVYFCFIIVRKLLRWGSRCLG